jgi:hypothetical protein
MWVTPSVAYVNVSNNSNFGLKISQQKKTELIGMVMNLALPGCYFVLTVGWFRTIQILIVQL